MEPTTAGHDVTAAETFARDAAMFQDLLAFMTVLSLVLWAVVVVTLMVRFVACHVVYRDARTDQPPVLAEHEGR
jgi:hypothetical protein